MRKVIVVPALVSGLLALGLTGLASGATGAARPHRTNARCGTLYRPPCTAPTLTVKALPLPCHAPSSTITLPRITVSSNAGIRKITVKLGSRTVKKVTFTGRGPTSHTISGLKARSSETPGMYKLTISTTDIKGKTVSRTLRFTICKPAPVFTG